MDVVEAAEEDVGVRASAEVVEEGATEDARESVDVFGSGNVVEVAEEGDEEEMPGVRVFGGTSCTWRFRGWFDFAGGGRTMINVWGGVRREIFEEGRH